MTDTKRSETEAVPRKSTAESIEEVSEQNEEMETKLFTEHVAKPRSLSDSRLPWLINDFKDITDNVYEGIMVAASRARQIGRRQKQEIDVWYKSHEPVDGAGEEEESEPGVDHFQHIKPTVKALKELSTEKLNYKYLEDEES